MFITFNQEDPLQVEAICEHYFSKLPKPKAIDLLNKYAFREPGGDGQRFAVMIDVTDRNAASQYEQRIVQVNFEQVPPFIVGGPDFWGEEYYQRIKYLRDAHKGVEIAGDDAYFNSEQRGFSG